MILLADVTVGYGHELDYLIQPNEEKMPMIKLIDKVVECSAKVYPKADPERFKIEFEHHSRGWWAIVNLVEEAK